MLVQFSVKNFLSFREKVTLSMVASSESDHSENTFEVSDPVPMRLLKSVAIYGANASGKSNLLKAMRFAADFVRKSSAEGQRGNKIPVTPFKLDPATENEPSEFEFVFIKDGKLYVYGFSADRERVHEEWLTVQEKGAKRAGTKTLFERTPDREFRFGRGWTGDKKVLADRTRDNALLLSVAAWLNHPVAQSVFDWLTAYFGPVSEASDCRGEADLTAWGLREVETFAERFGRFVSAADVGILRVEHEWGPPDARWVRRVARDPDFPDEKAAEVLATIKGSEPALSVVVATKSIHPRTDGSEVALDLDSEESSGTRRLLSLAGPWDCAAVLGKGLIVDELDASLHPHLTRFLVGLIHDAPQAQLIFTTHDCSLLDSDLFRRDQIWFTEKNSEGATCLYSLSDFKPRQETNIRKGYLNGRYGAIPFVGEFSFGEREEVSEDEG